MAVSEGNLSDEYLRAIARDIVSGLAPKPRTPVPIEQGNDYLRSMALDEVSKLKPRTDIKPLGGGLFQEIPDEETLRRIAATEAGEIIRAKQIEPKTKLIPSPYGDPLIGMAERGELLSPEEFKKEAANRYAQKTGIKYIADLPAGWYSAWAHTADALDFFSDKLAEAISKVTKIPKDKLRGGIFGTLSKDWASLSERLSAEGLSPGLTKDVFASLGAAGAVIPQILAFGPAGLPVYTGAMGLREAGIKGAAVGAVEGALIHGILRSISLLPTLARPPAAFAFGAFTEPGDIRERLTSGFTWAGLQMAGGDRDITVGEFIKSYPRISGRLDEVQARAFIKRMAPQVSDKQIDDSGGAKKILDDNLGDYERWLNQAAITSGRRSDEIKTWAEQLPPTEEMRIRGAKGLEGIPPVPTVAEPLKIAPRGAEVAKMPIPTPVPERKARISINPNERGGVDVDIETPEAPFIKPEIPGEMAMRLRKRMGEKVSEGKPSVETWEFPKTEEKYREYQKILSDRIKQGVPIEDVAKTGEDMFLPSEYTDKIPELKAYWEQRKGREETAAAGRMYGYPAPPKPRVYKVKVPTEEVAPSRDQIRRKLAETLPALGIRREKWGEISRRVLENYKLEEGDLENYIRKTASYLTAEGEPLPKPGKPKEISIEEIPEVAAPIGRELPEAIFERSEIKEIVNSSLDKLSDKEKKFAEGIMEGRSTRQDAAILKVSHETVREQRQKLLSKLRQDKSLQRLTSFDRAVEDIDEARRKGPKEEPPIGLTIKQITPLGRKVPKYEFADKDRESEWQTGRRQKEPFWQKFHDSLVHIKNIWTRTYENLPNKPEFEEAKFQLKRLEKQRPIAFYKTVLVLRDIVPKDADLYDRFSRKVILDDFAEEAKRGAQILPFGFDRDAVHSELSKINTEIERYPELKTSIENRKKIWKSLRESYIEAQERIGNHVEDKLTREDYYRHQVLKYAEAKNRIKGTYKGLRTPAGRSFLKKRGARGEVSIEPINIDYMEAESEVMAQMIHDIEMAKTLDKIHNRYGIEDRLIAEGKKKGLDTEMSLAEDNIPKGYRGWQPREGNVFYMANTISERTARNILQGGLEDIGVDKVKVGEALAVGKERKKWVIPNEVADTLDNFMVRKQHNILLNFDRKVILGWKKWILSGPTKILKYNIRNLTGDAEHSFVGNPGGFKKVPQAMKELYDVYVRKAPMTEDMKDWSDRGGWQTTLAEQEIKEISDFKSLYERGGLRIEALPKETFKGYWKAAKLGANLRESVLRYANYLDYLDQVKSNPEGRPKNFGASNRESVMALSDIKDRAFKLQNELIGAYDNITKAGQGMREFAWPFWSWLEVNPKIYFGLARNAVLDKNVAATTGRKLAASLARAPITALRLGRFGVKAGAIFAAVQAANNLLHKEEEEMLPEDVKNTQHLVLGTDEQGKTQYFSRIGALGDLFEWVGGVDNVSDILTGKKNVSKFLEDVGKSAVNQLVQGINPAVKFAAEGFAKKTIFPDIFEPKPIRNLTLHFFKQVGLGNEYLAISDLPSRPYKEKLAEYAIYKSDPLEASYYEILDKKREWLKEKGKYAFTMEYTPKNNALYYMKLAHKYGDKESEKKFLTEYVSYVLIEAGGKLTAAELEKKISTSINRSFENMNPLFGIKKEDLPEFLKSLDELGKRRLAKAIQFYVETLISSAEYKPDKTEEEP